MAKLENRFTWSASRAGSFAYCQRQYWWNYYGSWGGWEYGCDPEVRRAYTLKNLSNRWAWVGTVVHEHIEKLLRRILREKTGGQLSFHNEPIDVTVEIERVTKRMRDDWRMSRSQQYRERPKKAFGLAEHEYDDDVPREEWAALNQKACDAVEQILTSELWEDIASSDPTKWLPIEKLDQFDFEGTGVWAVLDFARRTKEGGVEIYDWKTGEVKPDAYKTQLGAYAMYMKHLLGLGPDDVTTHLVFVGDEMQILSLPVTESDLAETRGVMRTSIAQMRNRLRDVDNNVALREDFPLTEDLGKCRACVYRQLCGRS